MNEITVDVENYIGNELALFEKAQNWKNYYGSFFKPHLKGDVVEVGAGIGGTTLVLCNGDQKSWTCIEPDGTLTDKIQQLIDKKELPNYCSIVKGTLKDVSPANKYDAIIYIDVIEHIEDDKAEVNLATQYLKPGGTLIVLVPAHQYLYNEFDAALGHFRRYDRKMLRGVVPAGMTEVKVFYLDCVGLIASLANKWFLKQSTPTEKQISFWDKVIVPISRIIDPLFANSLGKTVIGIWKKGFK